MGGFLRVFKATMKTHIGAAIFLFGSLTAYSAITLDAADNKNTIANVAPASKLPASSPAALAYETYDKGEHAKAVELAKPLAEKGDKDAIYLMGFAHENGQGVEASREKAIEYYRKGQAKNHADSIYRLATILLTSGQGDQAQEGREILEKQAVTDPTVAGRILGEAFLLGRLTAEPAPETAVKWWLKSANAGDVMSLVMLGRLYDGQFGQTPLINAKTAYEYFLKAADKGDASAMVAVGIRLLKSDAVAADEKRGTEWLVEAIKAGNLAGWLSLGDYQANIKENPKSALEYYTKGADAGHAECMLKAAALYMEGKGTTKNQGRAMEWLEKSATAGNAQAHMFLSSAIMAEEKPDVGKAYGHLLTAANAGLPLAQNELGLLYLSGKMGVADISAAASWFGRAAQGGLAASQNNLGALHERGAGVPQNLENAAKLYALAAQQGNPSAMLALSRFNAAGAAMPMNKPLGWALAKLASEAGEKSAENVIKDIEKGMTKEELTKGKEELTRMQAEMKKGK
jgi:TPR repeat protein